MDHIQDVVHHLIVTIDLMNGFDLDPRSPECGVLLQAAYDLNKGMLTSKTCWSFIHTRYVVINLQGEQLSNFILFSTLFS